MKKLNNKTVIITGASAGMGKAIALLFADQGANVVLADLHQKEINEVVEMIRDAGGVAIGAECNVSVEADLKKLFDMAFKEFNSLDVLVNNAGVFIPGQVINEEEGNLEKLIETNLYSAYNLSRLLVPAMMQKKNGHIFNVSSVAGIKAYPNGGSYSISKFAMNGLSKALREELKDYNIKVTALLPGATYTDSWSGTNLPESRFMKAEDIAQIIWDIYHLSDTTVVEEIILRPVLGDI